MELRRGVSNVSLTAQTFRKALLALLIADLALVAAAFIIEPKISNARGLMGAGAAALMILAYGFLALGSPLRLGKINENLWKSGAVMGTAAGVLLGVELCSNYFIYREGPTNSKISMVVYGAYLFLLITNALQKARLSGRIRDGLMGAMWYVIVAQLLWLLAELASYYLFRHTSAGVRFIQTEMGADFARSRGTDFQSFVLEDLLGAVFFHLLLIGVIAGLLFGSLGGAMGKLLFARHRTAP